MGYVKMNYNDFINQNHWPKSAIKIKEKNQISTISQITIYFLLIKLALKYGKFIYLIPFTSLINFNI
ncbi:hypothetical protein EAE92_01105 [Photorhabdus hainanensis]|nr:hypothetical protein [Photorhabdus hainanensis]